MADVISPLNTVTFTVTKVPGPPAKRKTIERLMKMQPDIQKGLRTIARRRRRHDNVVTIRAGRKWIRRVRATKLARVEMGSSFTLMLTPQIIADVKSVEAFLKAEKNK